MSLDADRLANPAARAFPEADALAGLREADVMAHASAVAVPGHLRGSFNVNGVAPAVDAAAMADTAHLPRSADCNRTGRTRLAALLAVCGCALPPPQGNRVWPDAAAVSRESHLFERGVIVRPVGGHGLPCMLRMSVGVRRDNARLPEVRP